MRSCSFRTGAVFVTWRTVWRTGGNWSTEAGDWGAATEQDRTYNISHSAPLGCRRSGSLFHPRRVEWNWESLTTAHFSSRKIVGPRNSGSESGEKCYATVLDFSFRLERSWLADLPKYWMPRIVHSWRLLYFKMASYCYVSRLLKYNNMVNVSQ